MTAIPRDSTSVLIEYTKPIESSINGQLIGYDINYALNYPNLNWKSVRVNSSTQSFVLKGLLNKKKKRDFVFINSRFNDMGILFNISLCC